MESVHVETAPTQDASDIKELKLSTTDRSLLMKLAVDQRIRAQELQLARVRLDAANTIAEAESDVVLEKMGVPKGAQDVTIDTNNGIVRFKAPANP